MSVHEAFSKKDISTTAVSSSVTAPRCSRAWILGGVPWVRDDGLSRKGLNRSGWLVDGSVNSVVVRKINSTLLSLERLSTGVLAHVRERRCNWQSSVPFCGIRSVPSVSVKDLLIRISLSGSTLFRDQRGPGEAKVRPMRNSRLCFKSFM